MTMHAIVFHDRCMALERRGLNRGLVQDLYCSGRWSDWERSIVEPLVWELDDLSDEALSAITRLDFSLCNHLRTVPVEAIDGTQVATLCLACDEQLSAEWKP